jgi:hypothetical protein
VPAAHHGRSAGEHMQEALAELCAATITANKHILIVRICCVCQALLLVQCLREAKQ